MVAFEIKNKVALVTGGASGLGFQYALGLLKKGAKGVTLADVNPEFGAKAIKKIETMYGENKVIFLETDVSKYEQFEDAFKKTVETFKNVDILINNAGTFNDAEWEKEIAINLNGTIHGILLGIETYLPKYKSGSEGLIVNISSVAGIFPYATLPVYGGTKLAIHGMTLSWGLPAHYDRTKVRVVGVCPGGTATPLFDGITTKNLGPAYKTISQIELEDAGLPQTVEEAAPFVIQIIERAPSGTMWVVEKGEPAYQYKLTNRNEITKVHL